MFEKIVLASGNAGKLKEFARLFADLNIEVLPQSQFNTPECPEPYHTFVENALAKARHAAKYSGLPALADDSGICTNALNGAPGIFSARYAGVEGEQADAKNREKLLAELANVPTEQRSAQFVSTIVLLQHPTDPSPIIAQGACHGVITFEEKGDNGFGYDSLFFSPETGCTFAELETAEKKKISHQECSLHRACRYPKRLSNKGMHNRSKYHSISNRTKKSILFLCLLFFIG